MKSKKVRLHNYLKKNKKQHVIFDLDETIGKVLVDWNIWKVELIKIHKKYDSSFVWDPHTSWAEIENDGIRRHGDVFRKDLIPFYEEYESRLVYGFTQYKTVEVIKSLDGVTLSLWTANARKTVEPILKSINLFTHFNPIVTRDEVNLRKPDHEGFEHIHAVHKMPVEAYLFVGDSKADEQAAKGAGIEFLHVNTFIDI